MQKYIYLTILALAVSHSSCQISSLAKEYGDLYGSSTLNAQVSLQDTRLSDFLREKISGLKLKLSDRELEDRLVKEIININKQATVQVLLNQNLIEFVQKWIDDFQNELIKYYGVSGDSKFVELMKSEPDVYGLTYNSYVVYENFN